jgi:hypothetical protein
MHLEDAPGVRDFRSDPADTKSNSGLDVAAEATVQQRPRVAAALCKSINPQVSASAPSQV